MKIAMIGQKHYGSREGGVEVVVTELARRLAALGNEVTCYDRSATDVMTGKHTDMHERVVDGVRIVPVRTIDKRGLAAASSSFFATERAIKDHPDIIHYHAEGPCVPLRLAHRAGIPTVATIHGLNWKTPKWGKFASWYIKLGEKTAAKYADQVIVLSRATQAYFKKKYGCKSVVIPNGVERHEKVTAQEITARWGLTQGSYVLFLGRIAPGKGLHYLIQAFRRLDTGKRLVIAGDSSETGEYLQDIRKLASSDKRILFTGFVQGRTLAELYSNAYVFVLPSDAEGMPMSLLEAMSYGCCCVTSDIPECADVLDQNNLTFHAGNTSALGIVLKKVLNDSELVKESGRQALDRVRLTYNWDSMVKTTLKIYSNVAKSKNKQ